MARPITARETLAAAVAALPQAERDRLFRNWKSAGKWMTVPSKQWAIIIEKHAVPLDDRREHITDTSCWCAPSQDTSDGQESLWVHHSADQRERYGKPAHAH